MHKLRRMGGWLAGLAALVCGCDARATEDYRGEPLLTLSGKLVLETGSAPDDLVPALAFRTDQSTIQFLDVDTRGEFPANFSLDVMSPPPSAAMKRVPGAPDYAIAYISAVPADHPSGITPIEHADGSSDHTWCEGPEFRECYRRIDICEQGTSRCFHKLTRCDLVMLEPDVETIVCDDAKVIEQSGDPKIANFWENFAGLSLDYFIVYMSADAPAGAALAYALTGYPGVLIAETFGTGPIAAGYHLVHVTPMTQQEFRAAEMCEVEVNAQVMVAFNQAHGTQFTDFTSIVEAITPMLAEGQQWPDHEWVKEFEVRSLRGHWDGGCAFTLSKYERLDPSASPIVVTIGKNEFGPSS